MNLSKITIELIRVKDRYHQVRYLSIYDNLIGLDDINELD